MKKIKEFFLSLIIPHRMVRFKDMSFIITIILILLGFVVATFSNNNRMDNFVEKSLYYGNYDTIIEDENLKLPNVSFTFDEEGKASFNSEVFDNNNGIYNYFIESEQSKYDITVVFAKVNRTEIENSGGYINVELENFDIQEYLTSKRATRQEDVEYQLYVFTDFTVYHLYNLGQVKVNDKYEETSELLYSFELVPDENAGFIDKLVGQNQTKRMKYYLPTTLDEYNGPSKNWSTPASNDNPQELEFDGVKYTVTPQPKYGRTVGDNFYTGINFILYNNGISYSVLQGTQKATGFKLDLINTSLKEFSTKFHEAKVYYIQDDYKMILMILSLLVFIIIPIVFAIFVWLFTRKRGMSNLKNYINIMSIILFEVSILFFIIGWFVNLLEQPIILFAGLLIMLWYFIFVVYQITNRIERENNDKAKEEGNSVNTQKVELPKATFKKIDDDSSIIG